MKIHRIETGKVRIKANQLQKAPGWAPGLAKVLFGKAWSAWLPIYAWAIEHPEGLIIVDTGENARTGEPGYFPAWQPYYRLAAEFDVKPEDEIGPRLRELGIDPDEDVSKVVMTHLHTDHAGGLHHFPNAEILIHEKEYQAGTGFTGKLAGYLPHRWPQWLSPTLISLPETPFGPFPRSMPLTKDGKVQLVATPGHVAHHMSVIAEMDGLYYFLAGDTSYTEENMIKGIPDGVGIDESVNTLQKIQAFAREHPTLYLPSHDPGVPERMEGKVVVPLYEERAASG